MSSRVQSDPLADELLDEGGHAPSSVEPESPEEVSSVIQRFRRVLSVGIDAERIDAHREAVQREIALTNPLR